MKAGSQQPKPRRKKQKTDPATAAAPVPLAPVSGGQTGSSASAIAGDQLAAAAARAGQFARPPERDSSSAALARASGNQQAPDLPSAVAMPPPRTSTSAGLSGQGGPSQPLGQVQPAVAPSAWGQPYPSAAGGNLQLAGQANQPMAMPAESQGGSMASDSAWGTEEERMQRKLQRQAEKQRMK